MEITVSAPKWEVRIDGTLEKSFKTKAEAVKYARQYAKDMRESEGTKAKVIVQ